MAIIIKTPRQVAQEYLDNLKALRPEINKDQEDSDWWVRSRVVGGVVAGVYADLNRVSNDAFPQSARREAVDKHLQVYFGSGLRVAQPAVGFVGVTGSVSGINIPVNTIFLHSQTGNTYASTSAVTLAATTGQVPVQSVVAGQDQNLLAGAALVVQSAPVDLNTAAITITPGLADGRNDESTQDGANRVLARIRNPGRGGTEADYAAWAVEADASVLGARVVRHVYGLGTVQVTISAGTSDIDAAIDADLPVTVLPSLALQQAVAEYIDAHNPLTDAVYVEAPIPLTVDVSVSVVFVSGDKDTILSGQTVTQGHLVEREVMRAIYKTPVGGRLVNGVYALRVSDIEDQIALNLSAQGATVGLLYQIVGDRQVSISGGTPNLPMLATQVAVPGTITIVGL